MEATSTSAENDPTLVGSPQPLVRPLLRDSPKQLGRGTMPKQGGIDRFTNFS